VILAFAAAGDRYLPIDCKLVRRISSSDKVGIGVSDPAYKLTVNGEISIASGGESKYHINYYQGGLNFAETGVQDRRIHISDGGNVGIGTADPGAKLGVNGDLKVKGAFKGDISSSSGSDGAPFPRPAYDSDWQHLDAGDYVFLTHDVGGSVDDYYVDFQMKSSTTYGITNLSMGIDKYRISDEERSIGFSYSLLGTSRVRVSRAANEANIQYFRLRIWVVE
jgi:hypothetical protein